MKTRLLCIVLLLSSAGCVSSNLAYHDYDKSDSSVIFADSPSSQGILMSNDEIAVAFEAVDGRRNVPITTRGIYVSPGEHHLTIQILSQLCHVSLNVAPNHLYQLKGKRKSVDELAVQVWDETDRFDKGILLKEIQLHETKPGQLFARDVFVDPDDAPNEIRFDPPPGDRAVSERVRTDDESTLSRFLQNDH